MSVSTKPSKWVFEIRLGRAELAIIIIGLLGLLFLMLANLMNVFSFGDSTPLVQWGWVTITIALFSFTVLMFYRLAHSVPAQKER